MIRSIAFACTSSLLRNRRPSHGMAPRKGTLSSTVYCFGLNTVMTFSSMDILRCASSMMMFNASSKEMSLAAKVMSGEASGSAYGSLLHTRAELWMRTLNRDSLSSSKPVPCSAMAEPQNSTTSRILACRKSISGMMTADILTSVSGLGPISLFCTSAALSLGSSLSIDREDISAKLSG